MNILEGEMSFVLSEWIGVVMSGFMYPKWHQQRSAIEGVLCPFKQSECKLIKDIESIKVLY